MSETIQGYAQLQARIAALKGPTLGKAIMGSLAAAANKEQRQLVYERVHRRTGAAGSGGPNGLIRVLNVTATSAQLEARGVAAYIDTGTRAHVIRPKNKKALFFSATGLGTRLSGAVSSRFRGAKGLSRSHNVNIGTFDTGGGKATADIGLTFAKVVHHPGTKPHPFMMQGAQQAISKAGLADRVIAVWNGAK